MGDLSIIADLHTHTIASGHAYSTIEEICREAHKKQLKAVAITDHGPSFPGGPHSYFFLNMDKSMALFPKFISNVRVFSGIEANIININGSLDLPLEYLKKLDFVWASFHSDCFVSSTREQNTKALLNALDNPLVDGVAHPDNPQYPIDIQKVVQKAREEQKLIEINNSSFLVRSGSMEVCREIALSIRDTGGKIMVNSDAHFSHQVGEVEEAIKLLTEIRMPPEQMINLDMNILLNFIEQRALIKGSQ